MPEFPKLNYTMKEVVRAGESLKGKLVWSTENQDEIQKIFAIANNWRASHAAPMAILRAELHGRMSHLKLKGLTAARLKQMSSIRSKLNRIEGNLRQLQDLGGCRAVVPTIEHARQLVSEMVDKSPHLLRRQDHYMDIPRSSGYRSHHLIFAFKPREDKEVSYDGRLIEMQIRSRLQHSWATAVEAVGLYLRENLKAGVGSSEWLRLFELMSVEMAATEGCDYAKDGEVKRRAEIADLNASLDAIQKLESLSVGVLTLDRIAHDRHHKPPFVQIKYDHQKRTVDVKRINGPAKIGGALETFSSTSENGRYSSVIVEVGRIEDLKNAYPNYFGDVQLFKGSLSEVVNGRPVKEYTVPPVERVPPAPKEVPDYTWFRNASRRNWRLDS